MFQLKGGASIIVGVLLLSLPATHPRADSTYTVIHNFSGKAGGKYINSLTGHQSDPADPTTWDLYGVATGGGDATEPYCSFGSAPGCGVVFKLSQPNDGTNAWHESRIRVFNNTFNGIGPVGKLLFDAAGAIYGATGLGGDTRPPEGCCGAVYRLTPPAPGHAFWNEVVLHRFRGLSDGAYPEEAVYGYASSGLFFDKAGNLGGTTLSGTVFSLHPVAATTDWPITTQYVFPSYGGGPVQATGTLVQTNDGALYGMTEDGGASGLGTVFCLSPPGDGGQRIKTILHSFALNEGGHPQDGLIRDNSGALYGVLTPRFDHTFDGLGHGSVFKLSPPVDGTTGWTEETLHHFVALDDNGANPVGPLLMTSSGSLIGSAQSGGLAPITSDEACYMGCGIIFELKPPTGGSTVWQETTLHRFDHLHGATPLGGLIQGPDQSLFGIATGGGVHHEGVAFRLRP